MGISDSLRTHKDTISTRWEAAVVREVPALAALSRGALVDHLPEFLDGLAGWIDGDIASARDGFRALAVGHALQRHAAGIDLEALTTEYVVLRRVILEVLIDHLDPAAITRSLIQLAGGLDQAIAEAVQHYSAARDHVRERFIAILAHDLRDPLTAVTISASLLADITLGEKQSQLVDRITRSARRIERMIDDVLDFARGRLDGGIPVAPAPCDIGEVCEAAVLEARASGPAREITLETRGDLRGLWDRDRVRQVLGNLLANARAYGQGDILVRAWERDDRRAVLTSVTNQGPVIAPDALAKIFDPFARAASQQRGSGLGLGLYIVEQIAKAHGASCRAESSPTAGTTFTIEWPRTPLDETRSRPTS